MIVQEILNETLIRHYSDRGVKLKQLETGLVYDEAVDRIPCKFTYAETEEPIGREENHGENLH